MSVNSSEKDALLKHKLENDFLFFTRYFFKENYNRKFIVGEHHKLIANKLTDVVNGKTKRLIINVPPRYGKTELAVKAFIAYGMAINPSSKFLHVSYSQNLATANSEEIRDNFVMNAEYDRLFDVGLSPSSTGKGKWITKDGGVVYATATAGQVTGFGAGSVDEEGVDYKFSGAIVIDDPIKPEDAESELIRDKVNNRYESTLKNRVNSKNTPIIVIMQRLHEEDLCGYLQEEYEGEWEVLKLPAINEDGTPLWEFKHDLKYLENEQRKNPINFSRQYMQEPKSREGQLYGEFNTYSSLPVGYVHNYTDTADMGADYLCSISYVVNGNYAYVVDVIYDKSKNEITEPIVADMLRTTGTHYCYIESNNGGRAFSRNVERLSREMGNGLTKFKPFHQSKNKQARILSNASNVMQHILFPSDWKERDDWGRFYKDVSNYLSEGKGQHDDAPDVLSGICEKLNLNKKQRLRRR